MGSVFPGMDPYIEGQEWEDFHHHFAEEIHHALLPQLRPKYLVRVEKRVYIEHDTEAPPRAIRPEEAREAYLTIRRRETAEVVTVIEVLSPGNKRPAADGRKEYLAKREAVLRSYTHLIELDLLRAGERLPTVEPLPPADYYAFVLRRARRPVAEVYPWVLRQPMPAVPVPLCGSDPDAVLDLQAVFTSVYDRSDYDYSLDYAGEPVPPLSEADAAWARSLLPGE